MVFENGTGCSVFFARQLSHQMGRDFCPKWTSGVDLVNFFAVTWQGQATRKIHVLTLDLLKVLQGRVRNGEQISQSFASDESEQESDEEDGVVVNTTSSVNSLCGTRGK